MKRALVLVAVILVPMALMAADDADAGSMPVGRSSGSGSAEFGDPPGGVELFSGSAGEFGDHFLC